MPGPDDSEDSSMQSVPLMFPPSGIVMTLSDDNVYCPSPRLAPPQLSVGQTTWGISEEISSRPHIIFPILSIHHGCPQSHNLPTHVIAGNCLVKASQCPAASIAAHGAALWRQQTHTHNGWPFSLILGGQMIPPIVGFQMDQRRI